MKNVVIPVLCIVIIAIAVLVIVQKKDGESQVADNTAYHKISPEEAKKMMDEGTVTVVDVRQQSEYDEGHIKGAILVPNESIGKEQPEALPQKDAVLLIYCRSGRRSAEAAKKLVEQGYTQVYDFGGIIDWPYETVS